MAQLSKTAFLSKWATLFADNTSGDISEQDVRDFRQDVSDSFLSISDNFIDEDSFATNSATAAPSQQSVKAYVDAAALGIVTSWKAPVVNATTANITLSGEQTIDGVLTSASRILVKNQSTQSENGIYVTAAGAWARSSDANAAAELEGAAVTVQQGSTNANTTWIQTTDGITLGSSNIVWTQLGLSQTAATTPFTPAGNLSSTDVQAAIEELDTKKQALVNSAVALTDAASMDLTAIKHTLTTSSATRTFTISYTGDDITLEVTLNTTSSVFTFPATSLCVSDGTASGDNTCTINAASGDKIIIAIKKIGSAYYVVAKNFGQ